MIITCPSCRSRFLLENQRLKGRKLHCNRCGNLWMAAVGGGSRFDAALWRYVILFFLLALSGLLVWAMVYPDQAAYFLSYMKNGFGQLFEVIREEAGRYFRRAVDWVRGFFARLPLGSLF